MKLYLKTRNNFFKISILILIIAIVVIFKFDNEVLGNFLLGIFASTLIITIQYDLSSKVEESKLLICKLKRISDMCFDFRDFNTFSVDFFALDFEEKFCKYRDKINEIFNLNDELGNIKDLNKKTKNNLKIINMKIFKLEKDLYFILKNFENQNNKMKIVYFMEFYAILKDFNFDELKSMVIELACKIDFEEYRAHDYDTEKNRKLKYLEYETSIHVYNKQLEIKHSIEYKALKKKFETYMEK